MATFLRISAGSLDCALPSKNWAEGFNLIVGVVIYMVMMTAFAACGGGSDNGGGDEPIVVTNDYIGAQPSSVQMPGAETVQELNITANCSWNVSADVDWISIDPASGNGNGTVTITASLNSSGADRIGTISVRKENGTLEKKVRVTQGTPTGAIVPTINDNQYPE